MKVFNIRLLVLFVSSVSARVGTVQQALDPLGGAILNECVVMLENGDVALSLVNKLNNTMVNGFKSSGKDEILQSPKGSWGIYRVDEQTDGFDNLDTKAYSYLREGSNVDVYILETRHYECWN
jgi:hypothetical protein